MKPHKPKTAQRLAHWVKYLLKEAGVGTKIFKFYSVRGASTAAALKKGLHIKDILETADLSQNPPSGSFTVNLCRIARMYLEAQSSS